MKANASLILLSLSLTLLPARAVADYSELIENREIQVQERLRAVGTDAYQYTQTTDAETGISLGSYTKPGYRVELEKSKNGKLLRLSEFRREGTSDDKPNPASLTTNRFEDGKLAARTTCSGVHGSRLFNLATGQSLDCMTVTPSFCSRLKRIVQKLTKKDMRDFSRDLKSCIDTVKDFTSYNLITGGLNDGPYLDLVKEEEAALKKIQERTISNPSYLDVTGVRMFGDDDLEKGPPSGLKALQYFSTIEHGMEQCLVLERFSPWTMNSAEAADRQKEPQLQQLRKTKATR